MGDACRLPAHPHQPAIRASGPAVLWHRGRRDRHRRRIRLAGEYRRRIGVEDRSTARNGNPRRITSRNKRMRKLTLLVVLSALAFAQQKRPPRPGVSTPGVKRDIAGVTPLAIFPIEG